MPLLILLVIGLPILYIPSLGEHAYYLPKFIFLLLITLAIGVELFVKRRRLPWARLKRIPGKGWLVGFYGFVIVSTVFSPYKFIAFYGGPFKQMGLLTYLAIGIVFVYSTLIMTQERLRRLSIVLIATGCLLAILGLFQFYQIPLVNALDLPENGLTYATIGSENAFGTFMGILFVLGCSLYLLDKRLIFLLATGLIYSALLASLTRSAWIGAFVAFLILGLVHLRKKQLYWLAAVLVIATGIIFTTNPHLGSRFQTASSQIEMLQESGDLGNFGSNRGVIWSHGWEAFKSSSFKQVILGSGPDTYHQRVPISSKVLQHYGFPPNQIVDSAFNIYLEMALVFGVPALICVIAFWLCQMDFRDPNSPRFYLSLMLIGYFIQGCFTIDLVSILPIFWLLLAGLGTEKQANALENHIRIYG